MEKLNAKDYELVMRFATALKAGATVEEAFAAANELLDEPMDFDEYKAFRAAR